MLNTLNILISLRRMGPFFSIPYAANVIVFSTLLSQKLFVRSVECSNSLNAEFWARNISKSSRSLEDHVTEQEEAT